MLLKIYNSLIRTVAAYAALIQNKKFASVTKNNEVLIDYKGMTSSRKYSNKEVSIFKDFISKLNVLLSHDVINIDNDLLIQFVEAHEDVRPIMQRTSSIAIMGECRDHADSLKEVYDNTFIGTRTYVAGRYFASKIKSGGIWDYKRYSGTNTSYYVSDLRKRMTGESIGNFHYGYLVEVFLEDLRY